MVTLNLDERETSVLKMSIQHCIKTCHEGGTKEGCTDCEALEGILHKL